MKERNDLIELQNFFKENALETHYIETTKDIGIPCLCVFLNNEEAKEDADMTVFSINMLPMKLEDFQVLGIMQIYAEIETEDITLNKEDTNYLMNRMNTLIPIGQFICVDEDTDHQRIALRNVFAYNREQPIDGLLFMDKLMLLNFGINYLKTVYHILKDNSNIDKAIDTIEQMLSM